MRMTAAEQIEKLKALYEDICRENPDHGEDVHKTVYIIQGYAEGYSPNVIGFVLFQTEQSVYRTLRRFPLLYERAKAIRKVRMGKGTAITEGRPDGS